MPRFSDDMDDPNSYKLFRSITVALPTHQSPIFP